MYSIFYAEGKKIEKWISVILYKLTIKNINISIEHFNHTEENHNPVEILNFCFYKWHVP